MDATLVSELGIPTRLLSIPMDVRALDGRSVGRVTHNTTPINLCVSEKHSETIQFLLIRSPQVPVVLGFSWLQRHNPIIDWTAGAIMGWSPLCHAHCLKSAQPAPGRLPGGSEVAPDLSAIPAKYQDLREVFSKARATLLPPHQPYDCRIDFLPGTTPPRGRLYSLSGPENKAMEIYIEDSLAAGFIRLSTYPASAGFCYHSSPSAFELLQGATVFSKLDLRNAYHLVRIREGDEWKTAFNTASSHYKYLVMPFGVTNAPAVFQALVNDVLCDTLNWFVFVYLDDILVFSRTAQEHMLLIRQVFQCLLENQLFVKAEKCEFHRSTILSRQFVVEADASDVGVGAVLSQRSALDLELHPCAFFSHRLNT
uniref:ribonuclease H n=1 Tax=Hucho hucho TaxID=62062 RepID=A0A4W5K9D1_9TELE